MLLGFLSSQAGETSLGSVTPAASCERQMLPGAALRWFLLEHPIVVSIVLLLQGKPSIGSTWIEGVLLSAGFILEQL